MKSYFTIALIVVGMLVNAQEKNVIRGKVVQENSGQPVGGASIFINNSTRGTVTREDGSFELSGVPEGNYELIISSIGFVTLALPYTANDLPLTLEVRLRSKVEELQSITVEPDEKNGWEKWGKFFTENFIGTSANADECKLKNHETLRFRFSRKLNRLIVVADAPLVIENKALGYTLQYQLEEFAYDFRENILLFMGYPLFEDMASKRKSQKNKWDKKREQAYLGSIQHFMRSLYNDKIAVEGYEVKRLVKVPNTEKIRAKQYISARMKRIQENGSSATSESDSTEYFRSVLNEPDEFDLVRPDLLKADSLLKPGQGDEKVLHFPDHLQVIYKLEMEEVRYLRFIAKHRAPMPQRSTLSIPGLTSVQVDSKGNYWPVQELISFGYWAWGEKIANMLPLDYEPAPHKKGTGQ